MSMDIEKLNEAARIFFDVCEEYSEKGKCGEFFNECPVAKILGGCEVGQNPSFWNVEGRAVLKKKSRALI